MSIIYCCRECGCEVEVIEDDIAYCKEHPKAIIDSVVVDGD